MGIVGGAWQLLFGGKMKSEILFSPVSKVHGIQNVRHEIKNNVMRSVFLNCDEQHKKRHCH